MNFPNPHVTSSTAVAAHCLRPTGGQPFYGPRFPQESLPPWDAGRPKPGVRVRPVGARILLRRHFPKLFRSNVVINGSCLRLLNYGERGWGRAENHEAVGSCSRRRKLPPGGLEVGPDAPSTSSTGQSIIGQCSTPPGQHPGAGAGGVRVTYPDVRCWTPARIAGHPFPSCWITEGARGFASVPDEDRAQRARQPRVRLRCDGSNVGSEGPAYEHHMMEALWWHSGTTASTRRCCCACWGRPSLGPCRGARGACYCGIGYRTRWLCSRRRPTIRILRAAVAVRRASFSSRERRRWRSNPEPPQDRFSITSTRP